MSDLELSDSISQHHAHVKGVNSLALTKQSKNEFRIWSGSVDGVIKIWDLSGEPISIIQGHKGWISCIIPIADMIWTGSTDKTIKIWNLNGKLLKTISIGLYIGSINKWNNNNIWISTSDKSLRIYEISNLKLIQRISNYELEYKKEIEDEKRKLENEKIQKREQDLKNQLNELNLKNKKEIDKLNISLKKYKNENNDYLKRIKELENLVSSLKAEIIHLEDLLKEKENENESLTFQITTQSPIISSSNSNIIIDTLNENDDDKLFLKKSLEALKNDENILLINDEKEKIKEEIKKEYEIEKNELNDKIIYLESSINELSLAKSNCYECVDELNIKINYLEKENENLNNNIENEKIISNELNDKIEYLENENNILKNNNNILKKDNNLLKKEYNELNDEYNQKIDHLNVELEIIYGEKNLLNEEIKSLKSLNDKNSILKNEYENNIFKINENHKEELLNLQTKLIEKEENHRKQLELSINDVRNQLNLQYKEEIKQMKDIIIEKDEHLKRREEKLNQEFEKSLRQQKLAMDDTYRDSLETTKSSLELYKKQLSILSENYRHLSMWLITGMDNSKLNDINSNDIKSIDDINIIKVGFMLKKGDRIKNWKRRLFVCRNDGDVVYYANKDAPKPRGTINLRDLIDVKHSTGTADMPDSLDLHTPQRVWNLHFDTATSEKSWNDLINDYYQKKRNSLRF